MEIRVMKEITEANQEIADENRLLFKNQKITVINIMASPGAGKTSLILALAGIFGRSVEMYVIEGDIASSIDAEKIEAAGIPVVQINTGGGCHLDANMIRVARNDLEMHEGGLLFIENVGNLVCPSSFDLGESVRLVLASSAEGDDKPYKYLDMFQTADVVVLNKMDIKDYVGFDSQNFYKGLRSLNDKAPVFEVSCKTGEGLPKLAEWLKEKVQNA